jgi:hypothetical protein
LGKPTYAIYVDDALVSREEDRDKQEAAYDKLIAEQGLSDNARLVKEIAIDESKRGIVHTVKRRKRSEKKTKKVQEPKK